MSIFAKKKETHYDNGLYDKYLLLGQNEADSIPLVDIIYPVGSIYMSVANVSPASFLGGTWQQIKDTFLLSAGDTYTAGATGGEATHTLTETEMPSHRHMGMNNGAYNDYGASAVAAGYVLGDAAYASPNLIEYAGGGQAHNNMPPYLVVYVWERTA